MNAVIDKMIKEKKVCTPQGDSVPLRVSIDSEEGEMIYDIITGDPEIKRTLEVGCAYGLSSLHICEALKGREGGRHTIIDPFQNGHWKGIGVYNLQKAGLSNFELIETRSEFALPELASRHEGNYDFIFIDGWHTFDHTLVDCFYGTRLLSVGGYLVVDDVGFQAIRRVMDYFLKYPCYEFFSAVSRPRPRNLKRKIARLGTSIMPKMVKKNILARSFLNRLSDEAQTMIALRKVAHDERNWKWYDGDF